jgi:hypothetical protein
MARRASRVIVRASASFGGTADALVEAALAGAGLVPADCSHLVLAVNAPGAAQAPAKEQPHRDVETLARDLEAFVQTLAGDRARDRTIALADVAYRGGREDALEQALARAGIELLVHSSGDDAARVILEAARALAALAPEPRP